MPVKSTWTDSDTGAGRVSQALKIKYGKFQENYYNRSNPYLGRIRTIQDIDGEKMQWLVDAGYIGGAGASDTVPLANRGFYLRPELTEKTLQVAAEIEHKAREKALRDVGAFVEGQKHTIKKITEKFQWLRSFSHWGPGDGSLGTIQTSGVTDNGGGQYTLIISAATYQRRRFQKREIVNIGAGNTDKFVITSVAPSTRTVVVQRVSGSKVPAQLEKVFLQNAENAMPTSLRQAFEFTTGTLYGVTFDEMDWSPTRVDAASATVSVDMLNELILKMHEKCERVPSALYVSHMTMASILNSLEDRKNYVTGEVKNRKGDYSFSAVKYISPEGEIPFLIEPNLFDGEIVGVVEDMVIEHRTKNSPDYIKSEGGDVLHLVAGSNKYELRYCSYQENEVAPMFVGQIYGMSL
jgi:hypothetical protein